MKRNVLLFTLLLALALTGCNSLRKEVEPKGFVQEPERLVVACFISPQDTVLAARVTRSSPVLGTSNQGNSDVNNATVTLSDGSRAVTLRPNVHQQGTGVYYRANANLLPIEVGKTYTLTVRVPDGREVTATCTVPRPVTLQEIVLDSAVTNNFGGVRKEYYARLRWHDPAGQVNLYRVAGNNEFSYTTQIRASANAPVRDTLIRTWGNWSFNNGSTTNDLGRDGQEFLSNRGRLAISYNQQQTTRPAGQLNAYLLHVDENYYRYHDSVERQNEVDDNPFAEPVPILTNIKGGLGCFGAYNRSTLTINLK